MAATIEFAGSRVRLFNAHIDPHGPLDNQHQQTEALLEQAQKHDGPTVILGDFNTLSKQKAIEIRKLMESHDFSTPFPTSIATWRGAALRFSCRLDLCARRPGKSLGRGQASECFRSLANLGGSLSRMNGHRGTETRRKSGNVNAVW